MCTRPTEDHKGKQKTLNSDGPKKNETARGVCLGCSDCPVLQVYELHYACCVNTETKTHRYMRIYTSILQMMKEKYIDTHVTSLHYLFILIRFDRLQTSGLGFNVCLIEVQRHHHLRFRQNEVLHQWRLEIIADICWYTLPETNSFPLKTDTWKTLPNQLQKYSGQRVSRCHWNLRMKHSARYLPMLLPVSNMQIWRCAKQCWGCKIHDSETQTLMPTGIKTITTAW